MANLLRKAKKTKGQIHDVSAHDAGWDYVGFAAHGLSAGDALAKQTGNLEYIVVFVEGRANVSVDGENLGELGAGKAMRSPLL